MILTIIAMDGHWKKVYELAVHLGRWEQIDVAAHPSFEMSSIPEAKDYRQLAEGADLDNREFVIASLCPSARGTEYEMWKAKGASFATLIHPQNYISSLSKVGCGCVIFAGVVAYGTQVGENVVLEEYATISHDGYIGDNSVLLEKSTLGGCCMIGKNTIFKQNSVAREGLKIGADVTVECGAVVLKDIPDGQTVRGNPARVVASA